MNPLIGLAIQLVPQLLQLFSGDKAGQIGQKVADAVTKITKTDSPEEATKIVMEDPKIKADLQAELAQIAFSAQQAAFQDAQNQREADLKADVLANESTAGARRFAEALAASSPLMQWTPTVISFMVVIGFLALLTLLTFGKAVGLANPDQNFLQIINILIGALAAAFATVMNFWLGSSLGSRGKDRMLELQGAQAISAGPAPSLAPDAAPPPIGGGSPGAAQIGAPGGAVAPPSRAAPGQTPAQGGLAPAGAGPLTPHPAPSLEQQPTRPVTPTRPGVVKETMAELTTPHRHFADGVSWALTASGVSIDGAAAMGTPGEPSTVRKIWTNFGAPCAAAAQKYGVPVELIVATIATESGGDPTARRFEPKINDQSVGLMQTLVGTARGALRRPTLTADDLLDPAVSINAGTAYIAEQRGSTHFDPPLVAAAYNAGSIRRDEAPANRWKLLCYPTGTGHHIDKYVAFFSDCMRVSDADGWSGAGATPSFADELSDRPAAPVTAGAAAPSRPVDASGQDFPPPPPFAPLSSIADRQKLFGVFTFAPAPQPGDPEHIRVTNDWAARNIVTVAIPLRSVLGKPGPLKMQFHRLAAAQLTALWLEWEKQGLLDEVLTFDGAYNPRFIRGSTTTLSNHAFGTAFDINARFNPLKARPALKGQRGSVRDLVPIANKFGFYWGGHFRSRPDGMHFEVAQLLDIIPDDKTDEELVAAAGAGAPLAVT
ncbi:transglycosylase SLT domain-containing protein [Methylocella silvestris]|uniref:Transglycosylase SLT domain-containing protein n=1 Tax=Methylocella silvestris TaxID=199596 RepID=A0A2J7TIX7_METSI|nr:transglycosylase SLT domain-containing protein [Methylocella silvestris]PNG26721.1 hypothetical protein CR492_06950 [Methylocella silvestris]